MFENYFEKNKTPEQAEKQLRKIAEKELSNGVNGTTIYLAFKAVKEKIRTVSKNSPITIY